MTTINYIGNCGECSDDGSYYQALNDGGGFAPDSGDTVTINGQSMSSCIKGNNDAYISAMEVVSGDYPGYQYTIVVTGQGPSGWGSGSFYLGFQDATGDIYYLSIFSSSYETHEVSYNSASPNIVAIFWSDYSFTATPVGAAASVPVEARQKAKFKVNSPAK